MYEIIKSVITSGRYELTDMLKKIDTIWIQGSITEEQKTELAALARENADPENSYAPLQRQVDSLYANLAEMALELSAVKARVTVLEGGETDPVPEPEEWPEWVQPSGAHDAYHTGDQVTYEGQHYICKMDGCVWSPKDYPDGWELVTE